MKPFVWIGLQSFGFTLILTPIIRDIFRSYRVVDQPDQNRKVHLHPIPRVGGIAIAMAYALAFFLNLPKDGQPLSRELSLLPNLLPAALVVFATGLIDDFIGLKPWQKLIGQIGAAGLACWSGVSLASVGGSPISAGWAVPLTIGWLLVCTNAFNLVDGLDGLAAGVGFFATLTVFVAALLHGNSPLAFAALPLAGCLLGFLCFNFNPATVFLGDGGSLLIGFLLGCFGVIWSQKTLTLLGLTAPLMAMSIPLIDVLLCIVRRWLRHQPIFSADRGHIHHKLLDRGLTTRQTVLLLYGLCGVGAMFSIAQSFVNNLGLAAVVVAAFVTVTWMGVHYLSYAEFMLAGRLLRVGELQRSVSARLQLAALEKAILDAKSLNDCWTAIVNVRDTFGFAGMRMNIGGTVYEDWRPGISREHYWVMTIPIGTHGFVEMARELGSPTLPMVVVPFIDLIASALSDKLGEKSAFASAGAGPMLIQADH